MSPLYRLFCITETWKAKKKKSVLISPWASPSFGIVFSASIIVFHLTRWGQLLQQGGKAADPSALVWVIGYACSTVWSSCMEYGFVVPVALEEPTLWEICGVRNQSIPPRRSLCYYQKTQWPLNALKCSDFLHTRRVMRAQWRLRPNYESLGHYVCIPNTKWRAWWN